MKKHFLAVGVFIFSLSLDIFTKHLVEMKIELGERINVIGSFVQFIRIYNRGGVFGIFQGYQNVFMIISIVVFVFLLIFYIYEKNKSYVFCLAMGMIFSGAIGNILDRLMKKPGVVDFIYVGIEGLYKWPAFNVADVSIVMGAIILAVIFLRQEMKNKTIATSQTASGANDEITEKNIEEKQP